jgi:two-component system, cell cycle sensor histidine kinase and response regulator CckA
LHVLDEKSDILNREPLQKIKPDILAAGIAHDINNILATISGYAEMLNDDIPKDSAMSEKTGKIISAIVRAKALTNQLIAVCRQTRQDKEAVNVNDTLQETLELFSSLMPSGIIINSEITEVKIMLFADPAQLFRVFLNLVTNAIQSMEEKGGILSVSAGIVKGTLVKSLINSDITADDYALITFRDTGSGMDASLMQRIFEPFYTTGETGKGTGLGLYVARGIVNELGGEILVSSKENEGSVFDIFLPLAN